MNFKEIKKRKQVKDVLNILDVQSWRKYTGINPTGKSYEVQLYNIQDA